MSGKLFSSSKRHVFIFALHTTILAALTVALTGGRSGLKGTSSSSLFPHITRVRGDPILPVATVSDSTSAEVPNGPTSTVTSHTDSAASVSPKIGTSSPKPVAIIRSTPSAPPPPRSVPKTPVDVIEGALREILPEEYDLKKLLSPVKVSGGLSSFVNDVTKMLRKKPTLDVFDSAARENDDNIEIMRTLFTELTKIGGYLGVQINEVDGQFMRDLALDMGLGEKQAEHLVGTYKLFMETDLGKTLVQEYEKATPRWKRAERRLRSLNADERI